jgi:uncharacterized Fe-S radical SAM superfamily protein PflX
MKKMTDLYSSCVCVCVFCESMDLSSQKVSLLALAITLYKEDCHEVDQKSQVT